MNKHIGWFVLLFVSLSIYAQSDEQQDAAISFPQEKIQLHHNSSFFLSGEPLFYKLYCFNGATDQLSDFSKIAYVELINSQRERVYLQKIWLTDGLGFGDFFVDSSVPTGQYKLLAYTQAMRNGSVDQFFQKDILIINPFQNKSSSILSPSTPGDSLNVGVKKEPDQALSDQQGVDLSLSKTRASKRERMGMRLEFDEDYFGNYSVSVRKVDPLNEHIHYSKPASIEKATENSTIEIDPQGNSTVYLPELRGELITGQIKNKHTDRPVENVKIALSLPESNNFFRISTTNKEGMFYFNLNMPYQDGAAIFQIIGDGNEALSYSILEFAPLDYSQIEFPDLVISSEMADEILAHSIDNQIQSAYASVHRDSILPLEAQGPFYDTATKSYLLDDYTRFKTVKETVIEVVQEVYTRTQKGRSELRLKMFGTMPESKLDALLVVDGVLIQDHDVIINSNARNIKRISLVEDYYQYGTQVYKGLIDLESFSGNFVQQLPAYSSQLQEIKAPFREKVYHQKNYGAGHNYSRIPDQRQQLLWLPMVAITDKTTELDFYTSDVPGTYEVVIEGVGRSGDYVSIKKQFKVE